MTVTVLEPTVKPADVGLPCDVHDCPCMAAVSIWFVGQNGHCHVCKSHAAYDREHHDVAGTSPLPCWMPHGRTWNDDPPPLA